jgi:hypothetical protein
MKLEDPQSKQMQKDYEQSDIERLMGKREWRSYDEIINWLKKEGDNDRRFTPGEVQHMIDDFNKLKARKAQFITDPGKLFQELKS